MTKTAKSKKWKINNLGILFFSTCIFSFSQISAQDAITSSGGDASGSGGSVSYSVGQITYTTNVSTSGSLTQGVQQVYEISVISGVEAVKGINLGCLAYPNPTNDYLKLKVENYNTEDLVYQLYDMNGKLLEKTKIESNEITINMENYTSASYLLKVTNNNKEVKTFKIIKN
jgi:opacity protein-like surface antigen